MKRQPTYIKDTTDFIRKLEEIKVPNEALLVTLDIVSMYTNTPHDEATAAVGKALQQETSCNDSKIKTPPTECMLDMLKIILQNNTFEFNDEFYKQICGCSMGSPASPEIADITFHETEIKIIHEHNNKIALWLRFRDDIFLIFIGTEHELHEFVTNINQMHPTFKFSFESSSQQVKYLDLVIYKGQRYNKENILDIKTHTKPTDTFQFLHRESCHPTATFKGLMKGETLRYIRTCNNKEDFNQKVNTFKAKLLERGYKEQEITQIIGETNHDTRQTQLQDQQTISSTNNKLVFTTTYSPHIKTRDFKKALLQNWSDLQKDETCRILFPKEPIRAYSIQKKQKHKLFIGKLQTSQTKQLS